MISELYLVMAYLAGMLLGGLFFGGLWWTIGKCLTTPHPAQWMLASGLFRMSATLAGFYFVSGGQWQRLMACMMGFITARLIVTWLTRTAHTSREEFEQKGTEETKKNTKGKLEAFRNLCFLRSLLFKTTKNIPAVSQGRSPSANRSNISRSSVSNQETNHAS